MSGQYLKQLQERAQKLLQLSSDEDDEDINAYTVSQKDARSPKRIDLSQFLRQDEDDDNDQLQSQSKMPGTTDVELLKKCINLANENNSLRTQLQKYEREIQDLRRQLKSKRDIQMDLRDKIDKINKQKQNREQGIKYPFQRDRNLIERQNEVLKLQKYQIKKQYEEIEKERAALKKDRQQFELFLKNRELKENNKEIKIHEQYVIKQNQQSNNDRLKFKYEESQQRIRRLESMLREQKGKVSKICYFINKEIPMLKDIVVELTAKLDAKVQKYLLRDMHY